MTFLHRSVAYAPGSPREPCRSFLGSRANPRASTFCSRLGSGLLMLGWIWAVTLAGTHRSRADNQPYAELGPEIPSIVSALRQAEIKSAKPVGTSSVVFKLDLEGPIDAAFRPESRLNPRGHLAEIAAFRLGRALGLSSVAPAVPRTLTLKELERLVKASRPEAWDALQKDMVARDGQVHGVCIYWIPELHELAFDTPDGIARFSRWLAQDGAPASRDKSKLLAAQISTMLAFDYLIGNFDRFSGANMQGDASGERLLLRDHNMAFFEPFRLPHHQRVLARLKRAQRFSRSFVNAVRELDGERLSGALADPGDGKGFTVLTPGQQRAVLDRRKALLSYIAALIDTYGERNVLTFP
jgi:hypothetical protein